MKRLESFFHKLSFLQYPFYLLALYFSIKPYFNGLDYAIAHVAMLVKYTNYFFVMLGIGLSFASLQSSKKLHLAIDKSIIQDTNKSNALVIITAICTFLMITFGALGYLVIENHYVNEISVGLLILGISFVGVLKAQLELIETHRESNEP